MMDIAKLKSITEALEDNADNLKEFDKGLQSPDVSITYVNAEGEISGEVNIPNDTTFIMALRKILNDRHAELKAALTREVVGPKSNRKK